MKQLKETFVSLAIVVVSIFYIYSALTEHWEWYYIIMAASTMAVGIWGVFVFTKTRRHNK